MWSQLQLARSVEDRRWLAAWCHPRLREVVPGMSLEVWARTVTRHSLERYGEAPKRRSRRRVRVARYPHADAGVGRGFFAETGLDGVR